MPDYQDRMKDYVQVNERIIAFVDKWPDGCLQSEIVELTESRVTVKAYAYRTPDDVRPGVGHSSLIIPGSTPYTKGSEIENAETSAWGRAIAALGFEVKRGIASSEEVRNKQPEQGERAQSSAPVKAPEGERAAHGGSPKPAVTPPAQYRREELATLLHEKGLGLDGIEQYMTLIGIPKGERATDEQMDRLIDAIRGHGTDEPLELPLGGAESDAQPPKPGTEEYKALEVFDRSAAKAYWSEKVPA